MNCLEQSPRRDGLPYTMNGMPVGPSFSAIESTALFCTHVTMAWYPAGTALWTMWKIVVDLPVPGGPWMHSIL